MDKPEGRRGSDVLDAILDKVAAAPEREGPANVLFRAKALEQLDVAAEIDTRLPLVSRRNWLALVGVALLVLAFALWASLTPSVTSVSAQGRVVSDPGAVPVSSQVEAVVTDIVASGTTVTAGSPVATLTTESGNTALRSAVDGTLWQQIVVAGSTVRPGEPVVSLLPPDSDRHILLAVPEPQALGVTAGMKVEVTAMGVTTGMVESSSGPMSAVAAGQRTGLVLSDTTTYVLISVRLESSMPAGTPASGTIVLSEGTVLTRLLGRT